MFRLLALVFALLGCVNAYAARPPLLTPASGGEIVERLPHGYAQLEPSAQSAPSAAQAQRLLATAAATGDTRLAARAEAILARLPANSKDALRLRAFAAQHRHDFQLALVYLDRLVAMDARDSDALLSRAQVQIVQGRLDLARNDCASLVLGVDAGNGMLCTAALSLRLGRLEVAGMLAERWLAAVAPGDPRRSFALLLRADAASRANAADADRWYREAWALRRDDVRTLAAWARHLRAHGGAARAAALLASAPATDGIQLQRALAARESGADDADELAEAQTRRYELARELGGVPELRDEAEYELTLRHDPVAALALAQRNFLSQRDFEDAALLRRAAGAAGQPALVAQVDAWSKSQGIALAGVR
jgi:hypothetical protein